MKVELRIPRDLYEEILADLRRKHPFASERVGFVFGKIGLVDEGSRVVLLHRYRPVKDEHYLNDPTVGAYIGPAAMAQAMTDVYDGIPSREGIFHIHLHDGSGRADMSPTDRRELPPMIPGFRAVGTEAAHGIIILTRDHGTAWVWLPDLNSHVQTGRVCVTGAPLAVFEEKRRW
jgi:hypothetical protein